MTYAEALRDAVEVVIDGIKVSFLGLDSLIASEETDREQDAVDRLRLVSLKKKT